MAIQSNGSMWNNLPCESLALIAAQLEAPDRRCLAHACSSGRHAVAMSAHTLALHGSQVLTGQTFSSKPARADGTSYSSCSCACTCKPAAASSCGQLASCEQVALDLSQSGSTSSVTDVSCAASPTEGCSPSPLCSWLQHCTGVKRLRITSCDSCQLRAAPQASLCMQLPCSPRTPTSETAFGSQGSMLSQFGPGLTGILAAAGGNMPYLQQLDLSATCPCLYTIPGVLRAIAAACPQLAELSIPTWLLHAAAADNSYSSSSSSSPTASSTINSVQPQRAGSTLLLTLSDSQQQQASTDELPSSPCAGHVVPGVCLPAPCEQLPQEDQLTSVAGLSLLTSLKLSGCAPPATAVMQLAALTRLHSFCLQVDSSAPPPPVPLSAFPGWHGSSTGSHNYPSSSSSSTGAQLGTSLAQMTGLTSLVLAGVTQAAGTLRALSKLPRLAVVEVSRLPDFAVSSLASLSGLTGITQLRMQGCKALQVTARSALPLQLQMLQCLAVLELDFDLHLRDMQVLCLLKQLSHLTVNSFHHCIHLMPGLTLPALRSLRITAVSSFTVQHHQQQQQQQQQHGLLQQLQLAQPVAVPPGPAAGAAAAAVAAGVSASSAPAAAAGLQLGAPAAAEAAGGGGAAGAVPPVIPLSALPLLAEMHQQEEHQPYMLLAPQAVLLQHPGIQAQLAPPPPALHAAAGVYGLQAAGAPQLQQAGLTTGINMQLVQLRQQQLYLQQEQIRLQQQQVRLQVQQMQAQALQLQHVAAGHGAANAPLAAAAAAAAQAAAVLQAPQPLLQPGAMLLQQQGQAAAAAAAVAGPAGAHLAPVCMHVKGWLAVLFPSLEALHVTSSRYCAPVVLALQGHGNLHRLVVGMPGLGAHKLEQDGVLGHVMGSVGPGMFAPGGAGVGGMGCVAGLPVGPPGGPVPWGVLRSLPCLKQLELHDTAAVLGSTPWVLAAALSGQLVRCVLRGAHNLSDLTTAALLGTYSWTNLEQLEIEGAAGLTQKGIAYFAGLPSLVSLSLRNCPNINAPSLASCLLSSSSLKQVQVHCCAGVKPAEAQAVQDTMWLLCHRRVVVSWSRSDEVARRA